MLLCLIWLLRFFRLGSKGRGIFYLQIHPRFRAWKHFGPFILDCWSELAVTYLVLSRFWNSRLIMILTQSRKFFKGDYFFFEYYYFPHSFKAKPNRLYLLSLQSRNFLYQKIVLETGSLKKRPKEKMLLWLFLILMMFSIFMLLLQLFCLLLIDPLSQF